MCQVNIFRNSLLILCLTLALVMEMLVSCGGNTEPSLPSLTFTATPTAIPSPTLTFSPVPSPTITPIPVSPTPTITPTPAPTVQELIQYMLVLINDDRAQAGVPQVILGQNLAAQNHAEDMFRNYYLSHWGTDGLKPYMRYTLEGGVNYEEENSAYSGYYDKSADPNLYEEIDAKKMLGILENGMMYDDAEHNWSHRDNILNKWHKKVNIGIAFDNHRLTLVQQFEGDFVQFTRVPFITSTRSGNVLSMAGQASLGTVSSVDIFYDPLPQVLTQEQLLTGPQSYNLGERVGSIIPPPPRGYYYGDLPSNSVQADKWSVAQGGLFNIEADIDSLLGKGKGCYTVVIWAKVDNELVRLTNYTIFLE